VFTQFVSKRFVITFVILTLTAFQLTAAPLNLRWTGSEDPNSEFGHLLEKINARTGLQLSYSDFMIYEDRDLATSHFRMYVQVVQGVPVHGTNLRLWTDLAQKTTIQMEAQIEDPKTVVDKFSQWSRFGSLQIQHSLRNSSLQAELISLVKQRIKAHAEDPYFHKMTSREEWKHGELIRIYKIKGKRGWNLIEISLARRKILSFRYRPFAHMDGNSNNEFSLPALVYPIWEETPSGRPQTRVMTQLKHLKSSVPRYGNDAFVSLRTRSYLADKQDSLLGATEEGQSQGYWSVTDLQNKINLLRQKLQRVPNSFTQGVVLEGRYATVNLHPDILQKFKGLNFKPTLASQITWEWNEKTSDGGEDETEALLRTALLGRPLGTFEDAYTRIARRLTDHDTATYINDGFDEIQVYFAIDTFMDSLNSMGFQDPEISTRPFNAFLYNPDIQMRNNAFYDADTINFTTYDGNEQNYARDNATIWHELGHGIMDRLMGDMLILNDSGGLAEGMADFLAQLVIYKTTHMQRFDGDSEFRIINKTGFNLTNESHDDGEAYGGAMFDILNGARQKMGFIALSKVTDLTLETMRLTRHHPGLTAADWFQHMLFADSLGRTNLRAPGELKEIILSALNHRNFSFNTKEVAVFHLFHGNEEMNEDSEGTRGSPIETPLGKGGTASFPLKVKLDPGTLSVLPFPVKVTVAFQGGALQGAVHWLNEEKGEQVYILKSPKDEIPLKVTATSTCDFSNREDGSCGDYVYIRIFPQGYDQPLGKKRFYIHVKSQ